MSGVYFEHENHYDHILVGCHELCVKEVWELRDVMLVAIVGGIIMEKVLSSNIEREIHVNDCQERELKGGRK